MQIHMGTLVIILVLIHVISGRDIDVRAGKIYNDNGLNCTYMINGTMIISNDTVVEGLYFGLIKYDCDSVKGYVLSKPTCVDCGLYCPQNEIMIQCKQFGLPLAVGIIIGVVTFSLIMLFLCFLIKKLRAPIKERINEFMADRRDRRHGKLQLKVRKIMELETGTAPAYTQVIEDSPRAPPIPPRNGIDNHEILNRGLELNHIKRSKYPSLESVAMLTLTALAVGPNGSLACDQVLFMKSSGQICDNFKCQDINSYTFPIQHGSTICFKTPGGANVEFSIQNIKLHSRYMLSYLTSDYEIMTDKHSRCKQAGECDAENCHLGSQHDDLPINKSSVQFYSCTGEGMGCEFSCWHKYACTWYTWWLVEVGNQARVYKKSVMIWSFELVVRTNGIPVIYKFSSYQPTNTAQFQDLFHSGDIPITVSSIIHDNIYTDDNLLVDGSRFTDIHASDKNYPVEGTIGDYQIAINNSTVKFDYKSVDCSVSGCKVMCDHKEPALRTFRKTNIAKRGKLVVSDDRYLAELVMKSSASVQMTIGNVDFKNLFVELARCDVSVDFSYGCTSCNTLPYAVISSRNIQARGLMTFESNCTFSVSYLSCNDEPMILNPDQKYDICMIWIKNTNSTIHINFQYEFLGELTRLDRTMSIDSSPMGMVKSIVSNSNFIDGILWSMTTLSLGGLLIGGLTKIGSRVALMVASRRVKEDV